MPQAAPPRPRQCAAIALLYGRGRGRRQRQSDAGHQPLFSPSQLLPFWAYMDCRRSRHARPQTIEALGGARPAAPCRARTGAAASAAAPPRRRRAQSRRSRRAWPHGRRRRRRRRTTARLAGAAAGRAAAARRAPPPRPPARPQTRPTLQPRRRSLRLSRSAYRVGGRCSGSRLKAAGSARDSRIVQPHGTSSVPRPVGCRLRCAATAPQALCTPLTVMRSA